MRPTILLADDCEMLGMALEALIAQTATLLERVKDGGQLFERACVLRPDIIISDISMPIMNGLDVMRRLKARGLPSRFIFVTGHADEELATAALSEGAAGFLVKPVVTDDMREAIQAVARGEAYVPRFIRSRREIPLLARGLEHRSSADRRWSLLGRGHATSLTSGGCCTRFSRQRGHRDEMHLVPPDEAAACGGVVTSADGPVPNQRKYHRRENRIERARLRRDVHSR